jgi:putative FmdB family regulatory protein
MPIYAYKCSACAHQLDALQKVSDPPLTVCPQCGAPALAKQLTAAGFQLKGSGWYATDFKNGPAPAAGTAAKPEGGEPAPSAEAAKPAEPAPAPAPAASQGAGASAAPASGS